jgi:ParB-like chromosome segregation protein Spo0J
MNQTITWHEEEWLLDKLKAFDRNPRRISEDQFAKLKAAIEKLGYHNPIAAQPDGTIISGHQRAMALRDLGYTTIRVTTPSRPLTEAEFRQMLVQANINHGQFDYDILSAEFDIEELQDWGMDGRSLVGKFDETPEPVGTTTEAEKCPECGQKLKKLRKSN